jgi:hypothetical protein
MAQNLERIQHIKRKLFVEKKIWPKLFVEKKLTETSRRKKIHRKGFPARPTFLAVEQLANVGPTFWFSTEAWEPIKIGATIFSDMEVGQPVISDPETSGVDFMNRISL